MKIAKALKEKNRLAGEVARLKDVLAKQNVRSTKQPFDYNNAEVLVSLRARIDELILVKAALAAANAEIYPKIFRVAELKGLIATLNGLNTSDGVFVQGENYRNAPVEEELRAQIKKVEVDTLVAGLQTEIQSIQDELDEFNFTHSVSV